LREKIGDPPPSLVAVLRALKDVGQVSQGVKIHAHHIVMKAIPNTVVGKWVREAQGILAKYRVPLLETEEKLRASAKEQLHNICWGINSIEEIHSEKYAKAVLERLQAAERLPGDKTANIKAALREMGDVLQQGRKFW
jgi:hypothetical protein